MLLKNKMNLRFDLHFSYWIITWCIIGLIIKSELLPFYGLVVSILFHTIKLFINFDRIDNVTLITNIGVITIIKLIPILYILKYYQYKISIQKEIPIFFILLSIFIYWKYSINKSTPFLSEIDSKISQNTPLVSIIKFTFSL